MPEWVSGVPCIGSVEITNKVTLRAMVNKLVSYNRFDFLDKLALFCEARGVELPEPEDDRSGQEVVAGTGERVFIPRPGAAAHTWKTHSAWHPVAPSFIRVHRGSAIAFLRGDTGHGFTGMVNIHFYIHSSGKEYPKLFLHPLSAVSMKEGEMIVRESRPFEDDGSMSTRVYGEVSKDAIVHTDTPSHQHLAIKIAKKKKEKVDEAGEKSTKSYAFLNQDTGDFIGFTVHKGDAGRSIPNRFVFTSQSSNSKSFPMDDPAIKKVEPTVGAVSSAVSAGQSKLNLGGVFGKLAAMQGADASAVTRKKLAVVKKTAGIRPPGNVLYVTSPWGLAIAKSVNKLDELAAELRAEATRRTISFEKMLASLEEEDEYWNRLKVGFWS